MDIDEKVLDRVNQLLQRANDVLATRRSNPSNVIGPIRVDDSTFHAWKNSSENIIKVACGEDSNYYKNFVEQTKSPLEKCVRSAKGILFAVKEDVENGLLTSVKSLAFAEIFTDFLEMSEYLISQGYKDSAASLCGAILEDGLRKISAHHSIAYKKSDGIDKLNKVLADTGAYSRLAQRNIDVWRTIRNAADHGNFDEYSQEDVKDMIRGVSRFLEDCL